MADTTRTDRIKPVHPDNPGTVVAPDGRIEAADTPEHVTTRDHDGDERDDTVSGPATGTVVGAGLGAVIGGPIGAVVGAVAGAAAGKFAQEANRDDPNSPTGNPTNADSHPAKNDYFAGQVYEEGSLADVPIKHARDLHPADSPDAVGRKRTDR